MGGSLSNKVTLKDIADKTGYSINTVSRTLRGLYVSDDTKDKIFSAAESLGYIGNSVASSMRLGSTRIVTIILGDIANPHYSRIIKIFVNFLNENGYTAIIYNTGDNIENEKQAVISSIRQGADGILICPNEIDNASVNLLMNKKIPFVIFGRFDEDPAVTTVRLDDIKGGCIATDHLIETGCRNIVFVNGPEYLVASQERLQGYVGALEKSKIPYKPENVLYAPGTVIENTGIWSDVIKRLSQTEYDGILAFSDQVALKVLQGLKNENIDIRRIPIVGFDNIMESFPLPISISSVSYAKEDMALVASSLLLDMLNNENFRPQQIVLDVKLYKH